MEREFTAKSGNVLRAMQTEQKVAGRMRGAIVAKWDTAPSDEDQSEGVEAMKSWADELATKAGKKIGGVHVAAGDEADLKEAAGEFLGGADPATMDVPMIPLRGTASILLSECKCSSPECGSVALGICEGEEVSMPLGDDGGLTLTACAILMTQEMTLKTAGRLMALALRNEPALQARMVMEQLVEAALTLHREPKEGPVSIQ